MGEQSGLCQGKQTELYAGGEASGVSQVLTLANLLLVYLGEAIHVVVCGRCNAEVLRKVNDLYVCGDGVLLEERLALAVAEAEEHHIDLVEGHRVGETQVGVAQQALVHIGNEVAGITLTIGKDNLCLGMVHEQTDELTTSVACSTKYAYFNHLFILN